MDFVVADDGARSGAGADDMGEWEWPAGRCEELREIESLLRCQICGDFFHGPVLLPCSHAFCSECVRKFLQTRGAHGGCCPECKQPCAPSDLIANRSMEKVALLFQQLKPKLLSVLDASAAARSPASSAKRTSASDRSSATRPKSGKARTVERLPVVSYNVMKDKEVRKLLETIGIRLPLKNRDEIIQIHKEYVLLNNAQIDSCNPKSAARLRDEVIRNHKLRQQGKQQADAARRHTNASPTAALTAQMKANFERLKQEIAERKANPQRAAAAAAESVVVASDGLSVPADAVHAPSLGLSTANVSTGVWRHVYSHTHKRELYIHSVSREIRLERPPEFAQQQNPKNRYDDDFEDDSVATVDSANCSVDLTDDQDEVNGDNASVQERDTSDAHVGETRAPVASRSSTATKNAGKRPAGFFSPDVSAATQDFSFSSDEDDSASAQASRRRSSLGSTTTGFTNLSTDQSSGAASVDDAKWDCPRCTLVNDTSSAQCEACGYESKPLQAQLASARKRQKKMHFQSKLK